MILSVLIRQLMRHIEVDKTINLCEVGYIQYKHIKMTQPEFTI